MDKITFTRVAASNCELTKTFSKGPQDVTSTAIAHMSEGFATVLHIDDVTQLPGWLALLAPNEAITCGAPPLGNTPLTTRAGAAFRPDAVARTNEAFAFPYGPALFPIDVDVDGDTFASVDNVMDALEACSPWLQNVLRVARPSSSSYVAGRGLRGVHVYFAVTRGVDIPALAKRMQIEQWAAGHGHVKISKSGALLTRQLSDALVYQPSRLMFEASPILDGVTRDVPAAQSSVVRAADVKPGVTAKYRVNGMLDVQALSPVRDIDVRRFETAVRNAKHARRREAKTIAIDYQRQNAIASGLSPEEGERYGLIATRALGDKALPASWHLKVRGVGLVSVKDVLANLNSALGMFCVDPFDTWRDDLTDSHYNKAEIVCMGDKPGVWSHKLQEFFAFTDDAAADLTSPLDLAAEKLCGLLEYPEAAGKKTAPFVNVMFGVEALLTETEQLPGFDVCLGRVEDAEVPHTGRLIEALSRIGCANVTPSAVERSLELLAQMRPFDPWKDAVLSLPVWDGVPRLDTLFADVFSVPASPAVVGAARLLMAGVCMRQLRPGAPVPVVPVLIGTQGIGKSRFVVALARALGVPPPSAIAFSDDRRMSMAAARSPFAELSEMSGLNKRDTEEVKRWVTDDLDVYRAPYERREEEHPRRFVGIGTANQHATNTDATGNRRFMPILCETPPAANWAVELRQVFAEAKKRFCDDEDAYFALVREVTELVKDHNEADMRRGDGIPISDLDELMPNILAAQIKLSDKRRVEAGAVRGALDAQITGRRFTARDISQWLTARGWRTGKHAATGRRYYEAPDNFLDIPDNVVMLDVQNPFTGVA